MSPSTYRSLILFLTYVYGSLSLPIDVREDLSNKEVSKLLSSIFNGREKVVSKRSPGYSQTAGNQGYYYPAPSSQTLIPGQGTPFAGYPQYQPQDYSLNRPYFIPVWGNSERGYLYFPPQPWHRNNYPVDNPPKGVQSPNNGYLPSNNETLRPCNNVDARYGSKNNTVQLHEGMYIFSTSTTKPAFTREPYRPTTHPPVIREDPPPRQTTNNQGNAFPNFFTTPRPTRRTTTAATTTTTRSARQPTPCVWAIVSCCNYNSKVVNEKCFAQLGCDGPIWSGNPCETDFAHTIIENLLNHYYSK